MRKRIYLDYAASTPVDPRVFRAMEPYFGEKFGNAGSVHSFGQEAIAAVDEAREIIACAIGAAFHEIVFTGSATEANNLALRGAVRGIVNRERDTRNQEPFSKKPRIVISAIEHDSVFETAKDLERDGAAEVVVVPVNGEGVIDIARIKESLNERTVLVSVMHANNEVGTVQPISKISQIVRNFRNSKSETLNPSARGRSGSEGPSGSMSGSSFGGKQTQMDKSKTQNLSNVNSQSSIVGALYPLFHTDAAQAFAFFGCNVDELGVDLMTFSGHKMYGPKGAGALYIREIANVLPVVTGGGQEFGFRSGTPNTSAIVGCGAAVALAEKERESDARRISELRNHFWDALKNAVPDAELNGSAESGRISGAHMPHILNVYFPRREAQDVVTKLDIAGMAVSAGSACSARAVRPSRAVIALGASRERALRSVRFSFGRKTTKSELDRTIDILKEFV